MISTKKKQYSVVEIQKKIVATIIYIFIENENEHNTIMNFNKQ